MTVLVMLEYHRSSAIEMANMLKFLDIEANSSIINRFTVYFKQVFIIEIFEMSIYIDICWNLLIKCLFTTQVPKLI